MQYAKKIGICRFPNATLDEARFLRFKSPMHELLMPEEMAAADRCAIAAGPFDSYRLMANAAAAIAEQVLRRFADATAFHVLCGPGNNGGDGYAVARLLRERGLPVTLWREAAPRRGTDAARAAADCPLEALPLHGFMPQVGAVVVDALFGAGLSKPLTGTCAAAVARADEAGARVAAVDLPSGVSGASGRTLGAAFRAELTVTFFRKKPGHLLYPGRALCGETVVADIGISKSVLEELSVHCFENGPALWQTLFPTPAVDAHKYRRGHVGVFSGPANATGAARLAAQGAARIGAGAVTVLSPASALMANAAHLTAIMLRRADTLEEVETFARGRRPAAYVLGPGFGVGEKARDFVLAILGSTAEDRPRALVLDADGIIAFGETPERLFEAVRTDGAPALVLTPHMGEFARLFPDLAEDESLSKLDRARQAAERAGAIVVLKGPDTVIAAPDGRAAINANATPWLATAGSGDVLAGMIAGLAGQGMPSFEAACAAVWLHAEAGRAFGPGLIAEDLPAMLPAVVDEVGSE